MSDRDTVESLFRLGRGPHTVSGNLSVGELIVRRCRQTPERTAIDSPELRLSYAELDEASDAIARVLVEQRVGLGDAVGVLLGRSLWAVVAMLGIWRARAAFVPVDPEYPDDRVELMFRESGVNVVLTDGLHCSPLSGLRVLSIREAVSSSAGPGVLQGPGRADDLAYVMYTSGSTGSPKGVEICHSGILRLLAEERFIGVRADDVVLQVAPHTFDAATFEIWPCLAAGGRLVLPPQGSLTLADIGRTIRERGVTMLFLTTSLFHEMAAFEMGSFSGVRRLIVGGDVVSPQWVRRVLTDCPGIEVVIAYGPTEATTFACCHLFRGPEDLGGGPVTIGRPIAGTDVYILDEELALAPFGIVGELCIAGPGLARRYSGRPQLNRDKFVTPTAGPLGGIRIYRTGDQCRWRDDGCLEFVGRTDEQVKIRGHRVEPGEVEVTVMRHPRVRQVVVFPVPDTSGSRSLAAAVVPVVGVDPLGGHRGLIRELRLHCADHLPRWMIPTRWIVLDEMPLTVNGKSDREILRTRMGVPEDGACQ